MALDQRHAQQGVDVEQAGAKAVVDVVVVVGDVVGDRRHLRLQPRPAAKLEVEAGIGLGQRPAGLRHRPVVLGQPFQRFPAQIEAVEADVGRLQPRHQPDGVGVVVEAAGLRHRRLQRVLARMAERRVAEVVGEAQGLGQILVEAERAGNRPADLRDFQAVGQADPVMVAVGRDEHLRLVAKAAEGDRVDDPVAVALEDVARAARARILLAWARPRDSDGCAASAAARLIRAGVS